MKLALLAASAAALLAVCSTAGAASNGINAVPAGGGGWYFTVTTGGSVKSFVQVGVDCGADYATILTVTLEADGTGTSPTIFPPPGLTCTASLELGKQIGRYRVFATTTFST